MLRKAFIISQFAELGQLTTGVSPYQPRLPSPSPLPCLVYRRRRAWDGPFVACPVSADRWGLHGGGYTELEGGGVVDYLTALIENEMTPLPSPLLHVV